MDGSPGARAALAWALDFASDDAVVDVVGALTHGVRTGVEPAPGEVDEALAEFHTAVGEVEAACGMHGQVRAASPSATMRRRRSCPQPRPPTSSSSVHEGGGG